MNLFHTAIVVLLSVLLTACNSTPTQPMLPRDASPYISQQSAALRSARVSDVHYDLDFTLTGEATFSATTKIRFHLNDASKALTLDLSQATIEHFSINGKRLYPNYNNHFITLPAGVLTSGENTIEVQFTRAHSTNGEGLHRFVDPVDNKVYLYSHFEPAAAQQMFAVFDQPDLKAHYTLSVTAPKEWTVISAMRESAATIVGDNRQWTFPESPKLSPYNFSMHAGPYHQWTDNSGKYPLRLFARQSVAEQVTPQDWFTYTQQGLTFFDDYFGIAYPFKKYDQVLVPDFLYGAMENAAAITYSESRFLFNAAMTATQKERLAGVIMHEMAHQWFGNLVTMKWWNGLWLNESFASFMGTLATSEATEFNYAWRTFYAKNKQSAYHLDSQVSTHPIEVPVATTQNAFDNIDAITYSKGASALNQLNHLLGEKTFQKGVQNYLKQYSYQNATLSDFINSLGKAANTNLTTWSQQWLYEAGVNSIQTSFSCENDRISQFTIKQTAASSALPTLREQRVQIGLFTKGRNQLHHIMSVPVTYRGSITKVKNLVGMHCPDLVYPNYQDWGFVKVNLDPVSFNTAKQNLNLVQEPLLRSMLWQSLWDSVEDGSLSLNDYIGTVLVNLPKETDYTIVGQVLSSLSKAQQYLDSMAPSNQRFATQAVRAIEQMSLRKVMEYSEQRDFQRRWFSNFVAFARSKDALKHIDSLLNHTASIKGLEVDQDLRWLMVSHLNRYDHPSAMYWLRKERTADTSDSGQKAALAAEVSRPDALKKRQWLTRIQQETNLPFSKQRTIMAHLYPSEQKALSNVTAQQRLSTLAQLDKNKGPVFMRSYAKLLIPTDCSYASVSALNDTLARVTSLSDGTARAIKETVQQEQKCLLIKSKMSH
ncbi:aminopeptidase N [Shewanella youngdeokensis]|uniref:Aminopeptidase N n=1 Tax=Shewanella youngdeokensis TaxID=2999068 RepID=A0ABZ0JW29_9GAMM|nr:aminopeptidase N [Shewanella sp. DAU334]